MWTLDSRWFDVAAFSTLYVVLTVVFGHFEQHKPAWRRLLKFALLLALLLALIETTGRPWGYAALGLLLAAGAWFHFAVLSRLGINGWTGEPREKFETLLRDIEVHGEGRALFTKACDLLSGRRATGRQS
jgi:hypothetical protein